MPPGLWPSGARAAALPHSALRAPATRPAAIVSCEPPAGLPSLHGCTGVLAQAPVVVDGHPDKFSVHGLAAIPAGGGRGERGRLVREQWRARLV